VDKSAVQEKKIRVAWLPPFEHVGADAPAATTPLRHSLANGVEATPDLPPPAYSSPEVENPVAGAAPSETEPVKEIRREPEPESEPVTAPGATIPVKSAPEATYEELIEQLIKAQATILSLKKEAASSLRQRKAGASSVEEKAPIQRPAQADRQGTEGVPVQVAALFCVISFLLAYFFF
jgi:hypothetical protein